MAPDFFCSYLRKEHEARGTEAFGRAWRYFRDLLGDRDWCRDDICVDYIDSNRIEKYLQSTVGLVYKTLPVAVELNRYPDTQRLLQEVNRQVIDSFVNSVCDYRAETVTLEEDCIAVNYIADLGSAKDLKGFKAEELEVGGPEETMGGHADLYFEEGGGMITLHLDYLKKAYREEKMRGFIRLCAKYLKQITGIPEGA